MSIDDVPTLRTLLNFPLSSGEKLNLAKELTKYNVIELGTLLLCDDDGSILETISRESRHPQHLLTGVFRRWLNGKNIRARTWKNLILALKEIKMLTLAETLELEFAQSCKYCMHNNNFFFWGGGGGGGGRSGKNILMGHHSRSLFESGR